VRLPRFRCAGCGQGEYCRSTPELDQLRAHVSALMPYRVARWLAGAPPADGDRKEPRDVARPYA
jgi:hypothetical protein